MESSYNSMNTKLTRGFKYRNFFWMEFAYVMTLLFVYATRFNDVSKALANVYAVYMLARIVSVLVVGLKRLPGRDIYILSALVIFFCLNLIVNVRSTNFLDAIKIFAIFIFYFSGKSVSSGFFNVFPKKTWIRIFVLLPVLISVLDMFFRVSGSGDTVGDTGVGFFSNRNNAVLFSVVSCWLFILAKTNRWIILAYVVGAAVVFKTLGALAALGAAICIVLLGKNVLKLGLAAGALILAFILFRHEISVFGRAENALSGVTGALSASGGLQGLGRMNYAQLAHAAGTTDISFIFRLKHWMNLFEIYRSGDIWHQVFGFGVDSSIDLTDLSLLPHNDYLRFLFEMGPVFFIAFLAMNSLIVLRIGRNMLMVPAIFMLVYCFSDNIVNNFLVMSTFYFLAGAIIARSRSTTQYENHAAVI
ncbi:hypothetical protein [Paraburkholderia fungorum]|nr:hypothetical protein [Paraburkholderia fungorum]